MPSKRSDGQKLIAFPVDVRLLAMVEKARGRMSRSAWIRKAVVNELVRMGFDVPEDIGEAPDRVGKGGRPTHKKKVREYEFEKSSAMVAEAGGFTLPYLGAVAAGDPVADELAEVVTVRKNYPKGHFVVRVTGESMLPELEDGDLIVVDGRDAHTPGTGRVCVVSDGRGSVVKRWNRKRGVFESLNENFADLVPGEETIFQGYFVAKVNE